MSATVTLEFARRPSALAYMLRAVVPVPRRVAGAPPIVARWTGHRVDPEALRAYLRLSGLPEGDTLPLLYPHTFGFRLSMAILTHPAFPVPIWRVLQVRNHLLQHRALPRDAVLDFDARTGRSRAVPRGLEVDLHTRVATDGSLAWESVVTFFVRGRFGEPDAPPALARAPATSGPLVAEWTMRDDAHLRFGSFTGDYNGIHASDAYARLFGFRRALYHPPRVLGQCLARRPQLEGPQRLDAWLKGPVPHGARVRLHAETEAGGDAETFALFVEAARPSIVGRRARVPAAARLVDDHGNLVDPGPRRKETQAWTETTSTD